MIKKIKNWLNQGHSIGFGHGGRLSFEVGWFPGEDEGLGLQLEILRLMIFPRGSWSLSLLGISLHKICASLVLYNKD